MDIFATAKCKRPTIVKSTGEYYQEIVERLKLWQTSNYKLLVTMSFNNVGKKEEVWKKAMVQSS